MPTHPEVAILIYENVAGFLHELLNGQSDGEGIKAYQVSVHNSGRVNVLQASLRAIVLRFNKTHQRRPTHENLVEEVLDELFLERP